MIQYPSTDSNTLEELLINLAIHLSEVSSSSILPQKNTLGPCIDLLYDLSLRTPNRDLAQVFLDFRNNLADVYREIEFKTIDPQNLKDNPRYTQLANDANRIKKTLLSY